MFFKLDETLTKKHKPYAVYRNKGSISPVRILPVKQGTFDELKRKIMGSYPNGQFKQPRLMRQENYLSFLLQQVIDEQ